MGAVVLCEKQNQMRDVAAVIGSRYGRVMGASGHLLRLETPNEVNPERWDVSWGVWVAEAMLPDAGLYGYKVDEDPRKAKLYREIAQALNGADTVIIATDPDREGQSIGDEILKMAGFRGRALRAIYNNTDRISLEKAFGDLRDNREFRFQYLAAYARQNVDQLFGMSLTRTVTREMKRLGWRGTVIRGKQSSKIGVGRVRTPIWGMICLRELEIINFRPRDYFEVAMDVSCDQGQVRLWFRPGADDRIFERQTADSVAQAAKTFQGPIKVEKKEKQQQGPRPPDIPTLQKRASVLWRWKATKTQDVMQALYDTHKIASYPRAETRYLPEVMTKDVGPILSALAGLPIFKGVSFPEPVIRTGKQGVFSDKALEGVSHHAIIPNVEKLGELAAIYPRLSDDERKLFDLICGYYAACVGQPYRYEQTVMSVVCQNNAFKATGRVVRNQGWRALYARGGDSPDEDDGDDDRAALPPIPNGVSVIATNTETVTKTTTPPSRFTDGAIVDKMQNVWKDVSDPQLAAKLKETNGLGTPATRHTFIVEIEKDGLVETKKNGQVVPTENGMALFQILHDVSPRLFDAATTATLEVQLDDVQHGRADMLAVIRYGAELTDSLIADILAWTSGKSALFKSAPTPAMVSRAQDVAAVKNIMLPKEVEQDYAACKAWLAEHLGDAPSPRQVEYAKKVAERIGEQPPEACWANAKELSVWLDSVKDRSQAAIVGGPASPKQIEYIGKLISSGYIEAPAGWPDIQKAQASAIIDAHIGASSKGKGNGKAGAKKSPDGTIRVNLATGLKRTGRKGGSRR